MIECALTTKLKAITEFTYTKYVRERTYVILLTTRNRGVQKSFVTAKHTQTILFQTQQKGEYVCIAYEHEPSCFSITGIMLNTLCYQTF